MKTRIQPRFCLLLLLAFTAYGCAAGGPSKQALADCGEMTQAQDNDMWKTGASYSCYPDLGRWVRKDAKPTAVVERVNFFNNKTPVRLKGYGKCEAKITEIWTVWDWDNGKESWGNLKNKELLKKTPFITDLFEPTYEFYYSSYRYPRITKKTKFVYKIYRGNWSSKPFSTTIENIKQDQTNLIDLIPEDILPKRTLRLLDKVCFY